MRQATQQLWSKLGPLALLLFVAIGASQPMVHAQGFRAPTRSADRTARRYIWSWKELRERNIVMQQRDYSCGAASLATLIRYYWGDNVTEEQFLARMPAILTPEEIVDRLANGLTMTDLRRLAVDAGYQSSIGTLTFAELTGSRVPVIVAIRIEGLDHFVVYRGTDGARVYLADPIRGNVRIPISEFLSQWIDNAILAVAKPGAQIKDWSSLSVRGYEIFMGELNQQAVRQQSLRPMPPYPGRGFP
jgi:hypothetical protein